MVSAAGVVGLLAALALWIIGRLAVLPPTPMAAILATAILAAVFALIGGWRTRTGRSRALGTITLLLVVGFLTRLFVSTSGPAVVISRVPPPSTAVGAFRLVDLNALHGWPAFAGQEARYRHLVVALEALQPTVVVLQEAWSVAGHGALASRLAAALGMDVAYARANGRRDLIGFEEGSAVLSRLPIVKAERLVLRPRSPWWESRIALLVTLNSGGGQQVTVVSAHLTHRDPAVAADQAADLAARLPQDTELVVAGDFNSPSEGAATRVFTERGWLDLQPGGIDHVLIHDRGPWQVHRASWTLRPVDLEALIGVRAIVSDHPGIVVDLEHAHVR